MAPISLQNFSSGEPATSVVIIEIYVHKAIDGLTFIVGDSTKNTRLTVKKNPALGSKLIPGSFVRVINPYHDAENDLVMAHEKTKVFTCKKVDYLPLDDKDDSSTDGTYATLTDISQLPVGTNIPSLIGKVIFASPAKKGGYSGSSMIAKVKFLRLKIRMAKLVNKVPHKFNFLQVADIQGEHNTISVYGEHLTEAIKVESTYHFKSLVVNKYKAPQDKWHRLQTNPKTTVEEVDPEISDKFKAFHDGDGTIEGKLMGHDALIFYTSCPKCSKKWDEAYHDSICGNCHANIEGLELTKDFRVQIAIQTNEEDAELAEVFCFRKHFKLNTSDMAEETWKEEVTNWLVNKADSRFTIYFNNPQKGEDPNVKKATWLKMEDEGPDVKRRKKSQ